MELYGCILIGGASRRMGCPKHLLPTHGGGTWIERTVEILSPFVDRVVISGAGELPQDLQPLPRLTDIDGVPGPLSGIGAALRTYPGVSWLVLACDMPRISGESIEWLLAQGENDSVAVVPWNPLSGKSEPLFAWYGRGSRALIEAMIGSGCERISSICGYEQVSQPVIPEEICGSWRNYNYQAELDDDYGSTTT
jgi:molybdopterin-guanine dinucleotide biosynthesis protein A